MYARRVPRPNKISRLEAIFFFSFVEWFSDGYFVVFIKLKLLVPRRGGGVSS